MKPVFNRQIFILVTILNCPILFAQDNHDIFIPRDIQKAYENGSRSYDGLPGPKYFQNQVDYEIEVSIDPFTKKLEGNGKIYFHNNSGRNLRFLVIKNYHNVFRKGAVRGRAIDPLDAGIELSVKKLVINGIEKDPNDPATYYAKTNTNIIIPCETPDSNISIVEIAWETSIPKKTHERFGSIDSTSFFMAYWFPQVAVFDDINSWDVFDYNNLNEMYNEFGDFNVKITVPEGFVVWATGELKNPEQVLGSSFLKKYKKSLHSEKPIKIITKEDIERKKLVTLKGQNEWHFMAKKVNDFAFGASDHHKWSASCYLQENGNRIHMQTAWLISSKNFEIIPDYFGKMIKTLSETVVRYPFPYPSITIFNGLDGMEFPMIVNDIEMETDGGTHFLSTHEVAHSYLPFLVGTNQRRHGWIDEGLVTMIGVETHTLHLNDYDFRDTYLEWYPYIAGTQEDIPPMVNSIYLTDNIYQEHEYVRPATAFWILKDILGEEVFSHCLSGFIDRWKYKHPSPYDLFFTFNELSNENLNWFFEPWFIQMGYPDLEISNVAGEDDEWIVEIKNKGGMPFPAMLEIYEGDEAIIKIPINARVWKNEKDSHFIKIPKTIINPGFVLDTNNYPDVDIHNNSWPR